MNGKVANERNPLAEAARQMHPVALRLTLAGRVQGVGFRPFVYRLAGEYDVKGFVQNRLGEVDIVANGPNDALEHFQRDLIDRAPPLAKPHIVSSQPIDIEPFVAFEILPSSPRSEAQVYVPPDFFMCADCDRELHDSRDRRYGYPFINCTQCGPRYTIIESLPYDRQNTSMAEFPLCAACDSEYHTPGDRRFHAEPVACPVCGPQLSFVTDTRVAGKAYTPPLDAALEHLNRGMVVAVKGIGGYHLMCDAMNDEAVARLRVQKHRPTKPLAVMFPICGDNGLAELGKHAELQSVERERLFDPARPIVLAKKKPGSRLAGSIAPDLNEIGLLLPYSPLHQILLRRFGRPLVATSGNISGEPVITTRRDATSKLANIADAFLHHNRRIVRPADDSVYRRVAARMRPIRIGRGSAPLELELPWRQREPLLAVGGHMKGTVALAWDNRVIVSPHIGEMNNPRSLAVFEQVAHDLQALYEVKAERVVCDAHSGYATHRWARLQDLPVDVVWHHRAHASALVGEAAIPGPWLVFAWDGVGLGEDGTLWGGEALLGQPGSWRRAASFRPFRLPGGELAGREPWRSAAALLWESDKDWPACPDHQNLARTAWLKNLNCPTTSAAGRLFDAAATLVTGQTHTSYEAEGPMVLESLCRDRAEAIDLPLRQGTDRVWRSDWQPLAEAMTDDRLNKKTRAEIFHSSMAGALLHQALRIRDTSAVDNIGLTGGVFQNRVLAEEVIRLLEEYHFRVFLPEMLPCNDAALCYGQAAEIAAREH